jgi:hypothetical protein
VLGAGTINHTMSNEDFRQLLETELAKFFGHFTRRLDDLMRTKADRSQVEHMQKTLDAFLLRQDKGDTERAAMNSQLNRHDRWIGELSNHTGAELSPP